MPDTNFRPIGPVALTSSAATLYTGPTNGAVLLWIHVCNETTNAETFTMSITADAAGKRIYKAFDIPAKGILSEGANVFIGNGEVVQAYASVGSALTLTVSGVLLA